ncbi:hypothetical protein GY45DRAFT_1324645 [Cubamyces sp. BRFM 1775]|nr:hypothetical protein GY45DRAFT_1324645 [Cubamyces sp. BRFM 1775]
MPPRKKAKIAKTKGQGGSTVAPSTSVLQAQCSTTSTATIAQNKPRRAVRGRRGGLKDLPKMPLDIIMEIVVHLHPRDLLNLSRTTKEWRAFLMDRRRHALWKAARMRQEPVLPDILPSLSEPAYANLIFFNNCSSCGRPKASNVYWIFGLRLCKHTCGNLLLFSSDGHPDTQHMVASEMDHTEYRYLASAIARAPRTTEGRTAYLKFEVDLFRQRWQALTTKEEKLQLMKECDEAVVKRSEIAEQLSGWDQARKQDRKEELQRIKKERFSAIKKRLLDEGWGKELANMDSYECEGLYELATKRPVKLTDKGWNSIRGEVILLMQEYRNKRLRRERRTVVDGRIWSLCKAYTEYFKSRGEEPRLRHDGVELTPGDLAYLPDFYELLQAGNDVEVTRSSFITLMAQERWPAYLAVWQERVKTRLKAIFLAELAKTGSNVRIDEAADVLELAIAHFRCRCDCAGCLRLNGLRWQDILTHRCCRHNFRWPHGGSGSDFDEYVSVICNGKIFRLPRLRLDPAAEEVVVACGQDPGKVTFEEMQASPVRLSCCQVPHDRSCPSPRPTLDWLAAVEHRRVHYYDEYVEPGDWPWKVVVQERVAQDEASAQNVAEVVAEVTHELVPPCTTGL